MNHLITINGLDNPNEIPVRETIENKLPETLSVIKHRQYKYAEGDSIIPKEILEGNAKFVSEDTHDEYYVRYYTVDFVPTGYTDDAEICIGVMKHKYSDRLIVNVDLDIEIVLSRELSNSPTDSYVTMDIAVPKFLNEQYTAKLEKDYPNWTTDQRVSVVDLLIDQRRSLVNVPDCVLKESLVAKTGSKNIDVGHFVRMMSDAGCALSTMGIDITDEGARINWTC